MIDEDLWQQQSYKCLPCLLTLCLAFKKSTELIKWIILQKCLPQGNQKNLTLSWNTHKKYNFNFIPKLTGSKFKVERASIHPRITNESIREFYKERKN